MTTAFYSDEKTFWHSTGMQALFFPITGWVQPPSGAVGADTPDSKRRFLNLVQASGLAEKLSMSSAAPASLDDLRRIHPMEYINEFKRVSDAGGGELGVFAPFNQGGFEIAQLSTGLAIKLLDDVMSGAVDNGYALCRPAGHHCLANEPMGFCLFANIPIAIEAAKKKHGVERIAIVDWDVHHGNGTQSIYYDRPDVLTISMHQDRCFPPGYSGSEERGEGKGEGYNINIPMPVGGGDEIYKYAWQKIVRPALHNFNPDLIVVASGLDANAVDPLARMLVTSEGYRMLTREVMQDAAQLCDNRLALVHEGGYSEVYVPFCGQAVMETLSGQKTDVVDPELDFFLGWQPGERVHNFHKTLIDELADLFGV